MKICKVVLAGIKISEQNNCGGGPEQKITFEGDLKYYGGSMNPNDAMVAVLKDIILCLLGFRFLWVVYIRCYYI